MLGELKKFKALPMLFVEYKKTNDHKTMYKGFQSSEKIFLIIKTFIQSVMTKIKNSVSEDWIVKTIVENGLNIFSC